MKIQETLVVIIFGGMMLLALLAGQKSDDFAFRQWAGKDEFVPDYFIETWVEPVTGIEFVWIKGGCFKMGCIDWIGQCKPNEYPVHKVCLDGFWLGKYPITQNQWLKIFEENPSYFQEKVQNPVENVSWHDARKYIARLNMVEGNAIFRLPTEAEWEYACRGNETLMNYAGSMDPEEVAWYRGNSGGSTRPVGMRKPNRIGLFDMSGNAFEWVQDVYDEQAYAHHDLYNPIVGTGLTPYHDKYLSIIEPYIGRDSYRVTRGGSWHHPPSAARCSSRYSMVASSKKSYVGFRVVVDLPAP